MNLHLSSDKEIGLLKTMADQLDQGLILVDDLYDIKYINSKAARLFENGGRPVPAAGSSLMDLTHHRQKLQQHFEKTATDGPFTWTKKFKRGKALTYKYSLAAFDDPALFRGFLLKITDISDYANMEQQLNTSNERYLLATRASNEMIWERDFATGRYHFSEALQTIYGYDPNEEWKWADVMYKLVHPEDREKVINFVTECYRFKMDRFLCPEHRYVRKDGTVVWVDVRCIALYDSHGNNTRTVGVTRDISREHFLREDLRRQKALLESSNQDLEQFVYVASHDLQEPVRMVVNLLSLLEKKYGTTLDDKGREYIRMVVNSGKRMQSMIFGLVEMAKIGGNTKNDVIEMENLVQSVVNDLSLAIREKNAKIIIHSPLPSIVADKRAMYQVMLNLISNALKYNDAADPEVEISAEEEEHQWRFSVKDNGIGIDEKYHHKIFEMFQRLHQRSEYSGVGIGLAAVKRIVERGGGSIQVMSSPGKGSRFSFTVPR